MTRAVLFAVGLVAAAGLGLASAQTAQTAQTAVIPMAPQPYGEIPVTSALRVGRAWYGHGGFMGFGGAIVRNAQWMEIMSELMPDVAQALVKKADVLGTIKGVENNPVCAAFGFEFWSQHDTAQQAGSVYRQPFEWDSFFHPLATPANPMVEATLVAHGTPLSLFQEGTWKSNSYGAMERTPQTELGGVTAVKWRDIFVTALRRARGDASTQAVTWAEFAALFPGGRFRVILDVKTGIHQATPQFLAAVVREWAARGVDVIGAGTFNSAQNAGLSALTGGKTAEVLFFHGLQNSGAPVIGQPQLLDVAAAAPQKLSGKTVLFNGGFLIRYQRTGINWFGLAPNTKQSSMRIDADAVAKLRALRSAVPTMHLGIYVQEYDIDSVALALLNDLMNREPGVFDMGFAWGGKDDAWYVDIEPTATDATVGTNGQILFAKVNYL